MKLKGTAITELYQVEELVVRILRCCTDADDSDFASACMYAIMFIHRAKGSSYEEALEWVERSANHYYAIIKEGFAAYE